MIEKTNLKKNNINSLKEIKDKELSIQFSLDGFSFCVLDLSTKKSIYFKEYLFKKSLKTPEALLEEIESIFKKDETLQLEYKSIQAIHQNNLSTLVPDKYFSEKHLNTYLNFNIKTLKTDFIAFDELKDLSIKNVFIPYVNINNYLFQNFGEFDYKHHSTVLIEKLLNLKISTEKTMFVNVNRHSFEIVILENQNLISYNTFTYNTKEDFIYYILFTAEQLQLNTDNTFSLVVGSPYDVNDPATAALIGQGTPDIPAYAWDFNGTYSLSGDQSCTGPDTAVEVANATTVAVREVTETGRLVWSEIQSLLNHRERENYAVYSELDWRFHRSFRLIAGIRYEEETQRFDSLNRQTFLYSPEDAVEEGETTYDVVLPKGGIVYLLTHTQSVGFVVTKGYRGGFVETSPNPLDGGLNEVDSENMWSYEISYRAEWFDRQLVTNANAFYYDWTDQQVTARVNPQSFIPYTAVVNAGNSELKGLELTVQAAPIEGLSINSSLAYLETKFKKFTDQGEGYEGNESMDAWGILQKSILIQFGLFHILIIFGGLPIAWEAHLVGAILGYLYSENRFLNKKRIFDLDAVLSI